MSRKKKGAMELRFYEVPQGESVLALLGENWDRVYGHDQFRLHFHNLMEIGICRRGAGSLILDEEDCRYESDMISVIPENFPHTTISDGEDTNFWEYLFFDPKVVIAELYPDSRIYQNEIIEAINKRALLLRVSGNSSLYGIVNAIMEEMRTKKQYYHQMVKFYIRALVIEIMRQNTQMPYYAQEPAKTTNMAQIASALEYINENYASPMKAKELADSCNMSETHFRRVFEEYVNMAPMDYVNLIRIQKACELMKKTDDSMDNVALKCGFTTTSTFNRNFKKFLKTSPYQWKINPSNYERKLLNFHISALKGW